VEPILFNLDPKPVAPRHWLDDTWLNSASRPIQNFGEFDWDHVPKLDYAKVLFRQLATPDSAKVFDEADDFVLETFGQVRQFEMDSEEVAAIEEQTLDDVELLIEEPPVELPPRAPLPLPELADPALLLTPDSFWSPPRGPHL
jgi:hypothetical protein